MTAIIEIVDLTKRYGRHRAVNNLTLSVEEGAVFGFVGPNGAGKTSTIRIMATLLQASQGDVLIGSHSVRNASRQVRRSIGYMPDFFGVYNDVKVWEYLDFFGACYNIPEIDRQKLIDDLLELVDLEHRREDMVETLSRGMKQRLSLARTLIHDPQVLILDEPASGLDPRARIEIRELLVELSRLGKTIFFSTHILADVAEICTHVGIIEAGELVLAGELEELQQQLIAHREIRVTVLSKVEEAQEVLALLPDVDNVTVLPAKNNEKHVQLEIGFHGDDDALSAILSSLVERGIPVIHFSEESQDLEDVFMQVTKGMVT